MNSHMDQLGSFFAHYAQEFRDHPMLKFQGQTFNYEDIYRHAQALATYFSRELQMTSGTRVGIMIPNTPQFAITFLAAQLSGLVTVAINPLYTKREVRQIMEHADIRCIVVVDFKAHIVNEVVKELKNKPIVITTKMGDLLSHAKSFMISVFLRVCKKQKAYHDQSFVSFRQVIKRYKHQQITCVRRHKKDVAMLQYTSGTTGKAKGVMLSHDNILSNITQVNVAFKEIGVDDGSKQLLVLPFFHIYGLSVFLNGI